MPSKFTFWNDFFDPVWLPPDWDNFRLRLMQDSCALTTTHGVTNSKVLGPQLMSGLKLGCVNCFLEAHRLISRGWMGIKKNLCGKNLAVFWRRKRTALPPLGPKNNNKILPSWWVKKHHLARPKLPCPPSGYLMVRSLVPHFHH